MSFADVIRGDAFSFTTLTDAINLIDPEPEGLDTIFSFNEKGITTNSALIEYKEGRMGLVPIGERGTIGEALASKQRKAKPILVPHYEQVEVIKAAEVAGEREFGSEVNMQTVQSVLNERHTDMVSRHNRTLNFAKAAMIQGYLFDSDGTLYYDWFEQLGFQRNEFEFDIDDPNINIRDVAVALKRRSEAKLGGYTYSRFVWLCPPEMFDKIVAHPSLKSAYDRWQDGAWQRADNRKGFPIADNVEIRSYDINNTGEFDAQGEPVRMFPATKSFFVPDTKSLFQIRYAPADNMESVNKPGKAYYSTSAPIEFDKGVKILTESNFVVYSQKPDATVEVTFA